LELVIFSARINEEKTKQTYKKSYTFAIKSQRAKQLLPANYSNAKPLKIKYAEPVRFSANPYLSGFVSDSNLERIKNAPIVSVQSIGRGKLISYHESMTFRGIWLGTNKLFANSVFFGSVIR